MPYISYPPPPPPNSHKFNKKVLENEIIEKACKDFLKTEASHAEKIDILLALRYIHENLLSPSLSVKKVIEQRNIRTHNFYDRFAGEVTLNGNARRTPGEYIAWARIHVARRILEHGACNLKELASAVGFNSYRSFYRACRKHLGCKPSEAAKMVQGAYLAGRSPLPALRA